MPHRRLPLALPALLCVLSSTACAPQVVAVHHLPVPPSLLQCAAEPAVPVAGVDDAGLSDWILDLRDAGTDCRDHLAALAGIIGAR